MKLSEAIRLGATMKPQAFDSNGAHGSCALRAAADALGIPSLRDGDGINYRELRQRFPLLDKRVETPHCLYWERPTDDMLQIVFILNDRRMWSRERIADWVELHEPLPPGEDVQEQAVQRRSK